MGGKGRWGELVGRCLLGLLLVPVGGMMPAGAAEIAALAARSGVTAPVTGILTPAAIHPRRSAGPRASVDAQPALVDALRALRGTSSPPLPAAQQNALRALAQQTAISGGVKLSVRPADGGIAWLKPNAGRLPLPSAAAGAPHWSRRQRVARFLDDNKALLRLRDPASELRLSGESRDRLGATHLRYRQTWQGIPVWGRELRVHLDGDDNLYLLQGDYQPAPTTAATTPRLSGAQALAAAQRHGGFAQTPQAVSSELVYYPEAAGGVRLSYLLEFSIGLEQRWIYLVDALSGVIVHRINNLQTETVQGRGKDLNGVDRSFNVWHGTTDYFLLDVDTPTPGGRADPVQEGPQATGDLYIYDARHQTSGALALISNPSAESWNDAAAVSAVYNTRLVYDYYKQTFGRDSMDGKGMNLLAVVRFDNGLENAFWNGTYMVYGDGGSTVSNFAGCTDVAAHEMTHGVIQSSAGLLYETQSGALNESFADVMAAMVDSANWTLAENCTRVAPGYVRNLQDPSLGLSPQPARMSDYRNLANTPEQDNGGVHVNSGIPNRAAYLIAEGLSAEGLGTSIGRGKTAQIYYRALTVYLTQSSQFSDARRALLQAAEDLYGAGTAETQAVAAAFDAVEITDTGASTPGNSRPSPTDPVTGNDAMVFLSPRDGSHDNASEAFDLYLQVMDRPFGDALQASVRGPYNRDANDQPALYTRPAALTGRNGTLLLYVAADFNVYVASIGTTDEPLTTSGDVGSIALAPTGAYAAYTPAGENDNNIYVIDIASGATIAYPVYAKTFDQGGTGADTILYADALAFDYSGGLIVFDALNCLDLQNSACASGGGYRYWSIGVLDLKRNDISYPVPGQNPEISLGYPSFAANNNFIIVADRFDFTNSAATGLVASAALALNTETGKYNVLVDQGSAAQPFGSLAGFWGDDDYITTQQPVSDSQHIMAFRRPVNGDFSVDPGAAVQLLNNMAVALPLMHRQGLRVLTGALAADRTLLDLGDVAVGATAQATLTIRNSGNNDIKITAISLDNPSFSHNGVNTMVPRGQEIAVSVSYTPAQAAGAETATLTFVNDGTGGNLAISLLANAIGGEPPAMKEKTKSGGGGGVMDWLSLLLLLPPLLRLRERRPRS